MRVKVADREEQIKIDIDIEGLCRSEFLDFNLSLNLPEHFASA
jgi:hypothetical protein